VGVQFFIVPRRYRITPPLYAHRAVELQRGGIPVWVEIYIEGGIQREWNILALLYDPALQYGYSITPTP